MKSAVAAVALLWCALTYAQKSISAREAKDHVGQKATVCGKVASANYAVGSPGSPTFLNLDRAYPHQVFTIVIWGAIAQSLESRRLVLLRKIFVSQAR